MPTESSRIYILLKCTWNIIWDRSHVRPQTNFNKFKKIKILSNIFFNHNGRKLEINYRKKAVKVTNMWRLNNMLLNNQWVKEEIKGRIKEKP